MESVLGPYIGCQFRMNEYVLTFGTLLSNEAVQLWYQQQERTKLDDHDSRQSANHVMQLSEHSDFGAQAHGTSSLVKGKA
jgi:hypothetical protein